MSDMANTDPEWIDGVRMTWNVWPRTKVEANKCVIGAPQSLPSPVYVFVLDTCMIEEEVGFVKSALKRAVELVPDNALVGFVSFGNQVQVHELGSSDLSKVYVFRGSKEISKEQVLEQLGLGVLGRRPSPKGVQNGCPNASVTRFLLPASDCEYTLNTLLDKLQTDQWSVAPGNPASRCTGVALSVAAGLLGACVPGTGARIVALVGGPCTEGPAAIVWKDLSEPVRSHKDLAAAGAEYDSVSNNGSWSGESEDHKDKTSNPPARQEALPKADNDKREKIRQKNERKHQRQKERRAQELHERCSSYLMSRKLEALAQQLVAMGFSQERATMALILNEGRVEESVAWLFEGGEDADQLRDQNNFGGGNLKIDISEELARISDMETRFKCSKQEVERAIVACEGDLQKAAESLRESKQDPPSLSPKPEETGDPPTGTNGKLPVAVSQNLRPQTKPNPSPTIQQRRDVKDFNYTKQGAQVGGVSLESASKTMQPLKRGQPKLEWAKPQQTPVPADRRWSNAGSNPSVSYSLASPLQVSSPPVKTETRYVAVGGELKNLQPGTVREPVIMMQRPQSVNTKQVPATSMSSSPPGSTTSWYPSTSVDMMRSSGFLPNIPSNLNSNQMYHQFQYQPQQQLVPGSNPADSPGTSRGNNLWSRAGASPTLAAASSLGLFSGLGSSGASSPAASSPAYWNAGGGGSGGQVDYTNIDWSLDRGLSSSSRPNGLWTGLPSIMKSNTNFYDPKTTGSGAQPGMRMPSSNMNSVSLVGLHDGAANVEASSAGSREWTSPFEGEDLFSLPRQFVSSSL